MLMQYLGHMLKKLSLICNSNTTGHPVFYLTTCDSSFQPGVSNHFSPNSKPFAKGLRRCDLILSLQRGEAEQASSSSSTIIFISQWKRRLGGWQRFPAEVRAALAAPWTHLQGVVITYMCLGNVHNVCNFEMYQKIKWMNAWIEA